MEWQQHSSMPHILFASTQGRGMLMLHFACQACGQTLDWRCEGRVGMPLYRLNVFANEHRHGYPPIMQQMPR